MDLWLEALSKAREPPCCPAMAEGMVLPLVFRAVSPPDFGAFVTGFALTAYSFRWRDGEERLEGAPSLAELWTSGRSRSDPLHPVLQGLPCLPPLFKEASSMFVCWTARPPPPALGDAVVVSPPHPLRRSSLEKVSRIE